MSKFKFKKKYGQNFLKNEEIVNRIVNSIEPRENDLIIEIGPGSGVLTAKFKKYKARIIGFEIDDETKKYLDPLVDEKTKIYFEDFLKVDLKEKLKDIRYDKIFVVGNLPYYITTPIIEHVINSQVEIDSFTMMVQKEVADRFLAKPKTKNYGYITVLLNYHFDIEKIIEAKPEDFTPSPKVSSTVIKMTTRKKEIVDYEKFKKIVSDSFKFKRKTIANNLKDYDLEKVKSVLIENGYSLSSRGEEIDLNTFIQLANYL